MPSWIEVAIRSISIILGLFLITKILGKKQLSALSFFEYIVGITIGDIAGTLSMDPELQLGDGITSIIIWSLIPIIISYFSIRSIKFREIVEGKASVFIKNGKIMEDNLKKEKYTADELLEQLRKQQVFQIADVEYASLEPTGDISVLLKKKKQPLTYGDLFSNASSIKEPQTVVMDGKMLDEPLSTIGLNRGWLKEELDKLGVTIESVFLGQVDSYGQLTVDLYDDKIEIPPPSAKKLLMASIKKTEADFELYALQTNADSAKQMYIINAQKMRDIKSKVSPYLR